MSDVLLLQRPLPVAAAGVATATILGNLHNNFAGGTAGTTITTGNSGGGNDTIFTAVNGTPVFGAVSHNSASGMSIIDQSLNSRVGWSSMGSITAPTFFRFYIYLKAYPVTNRAYVLRLNTAAAGLCALLRIFTTGQMSASDSTDSGFGADGSVLVALNQWVRIEARIVASTTRGELQWVLYNNAESSVPSEDLGNFKNLTLGANIDQALFGLSQTNPATPFTISFGDVGVSYTNWLGSSVVPAHGTTLDVVLSSTISATDITLIQSTGYTVDAATSTPVTLQPMVSPVPRIPSVSVSNPISVTDQALNFSDTVSPTTTPKVTDTALSFSDTVGKAVTKNISDTAMTASDTIVTTRVRTGITDNALSPSTPVAAGTASGPFNAYTYNATVDADANFLVVLLGTTSASTASGVTFDGVAMYRIGTVIANSIRAEAWGLANPHTGTLSVVITGMSGGAGNGAWAFKNVGTSPGTDSGIGSTFSGVGGPFVTNAITGAASGMLVAITAASAGDLTATGGTEGFSDNGGETAARFTADGTAQTQSWTTSGSTPNVSIMTVALQPVPFDSVGIKHVPSVSDTALAVSDSVAKVVVKNVSDTALSMSDSVATIRVRGIADTALSFSDTPASTRVRSVTDSGLSFSDSVATLRARTLTDTGISLSDTVAKVVLKNVSDNALAFSESIARVQTRSVTDTGVTFTDAVAKSILKNVSDTALSLTDAVVKVQTRLISDNAVSRTGVRTGLGNTFEGGTDSVVLVTLPLPGNTGFGSGDVFQTVTGSPAFTTAQAHSGSVAMQIVDATTATYVEYSGLGSLTTPTFFRFYLYLTAYPTTNRAYVLRLNTDTGSACAFMRIFTSGAVSAADASNSGFGADGAVPVALNQWVRIEARVVPSSTVGELNWRLYNNPDSLIPSEDSGNFTSLALGTNVDRALFGLPTGAFPSTPFTIGFDDLNAAATTWPGPNVSDSLTSTPQRSISDTALSFSDSPSTVRQHAVSDTALTVSDSITLALSRSVADTAVSISDTVSSLRTRLVNDTALSFTDSPATTRQRQVTDTGLSFSDALATLRTRLVADTALSVSDTVTKLVQKNVADTALSFSDSLASVILRSVTETLAFSDTVASARTRTLADTALGFSDTVSATGAGNVSVTDTGLAFSDSVSRTAAHSRTTTDTGLTFSDSVARTASSTRTVSDTVLSFTDTVSRNATRTRNVTDTFTFSDSPRIAPTRQVTDTFTFSDSISSSGTRSLVVTETFFFSDTVVATKTTTTVFAPPLLAQLI